MSEFDRVRGSSKAFLIITLIIFLIYKFIVLLRLIKTKADQEVIAIVPGVMETFKRVFETELFYSYLIFFVAIAMGAMYEFLFIIAFCLTLLTGVLTFAHFKNNEKLRLVAKVGNVTLTIVAFINIFACDLYYNDFLQ